MLTIEEKLAAAAAKVTEALEERASRAWRTRVKLEELPIGRDLAKAFDEWEMLAGIVKTAEPEAVEVPTTVVRRAPPSKTHPWRTNPVKRQ
jgi:benzoyl-CoA reductase/2-hydroxyglutaryl-CoA dehydratase subunit BcrC/BadD/HgdB